MRSWALWTLFEGVVTRSSDPGAKQGISRDCVKLRLKATHLLSVPSKGGSLKPLGTLAGDAVAAATLSATRPVMSEAVIPTGEVVVASVIVASEMEARGKSRETLCPCWTTLWWPRRKEWWRHRSRPAPTR